ncbi:hypothetical protein [Engelhardtia mirabilis]
MALTLPLAGCAEGQDASDPVLETRRSLASPVGRTLPGLEDSLHTDEVELEVIHRSLAGPDQPTFFAGWRGEPWPVAVGRYEFLEGGLLLLEGGGGGDWFENTWVYFLIDLSGPAEELIAVGVHHASDSPGLTSGFKAVSGGAVTLDLRPGDDWSTVIEFRLGLLGSQYIEGPAVVSGVLTWNVGADQPPRPTEGGPPPVDGAQVWMPVALDYWRARAEDAGR